MRLIEALNNKLKQRVTTFKAAVILGFFIGFGIISNIVPPEAGRDIGKAGFLFAILIGFTFWGISYNMATMLISNLVEWILKDFFRIKVDKEKLFILITLSIAPLALGTITGIARMIDSAFDMQVYTFTALALLTLITIYLNISEIRRKGVEELGNNKKST